MHAHLLHRPPVLTGGERTDCGPSAMPGS